MFDMINIFEVFLPQLLRYPNPNDPLNGEAAALLMRHPKDYDMKVRGEFLMFCVVVLFFASNIITDYVRLYATLEEIDKVKGKQEDEDEDQEMSDVGSLSDEEQVAGLMDL